MANFHTDEWIMAQVGRHYCEALKRYPEDRIIGVFLQGSQNYGLDYEGSDIDTKCILAPSWEDLCFNRKAISTTHVLDNEEHLDAKDIRLYMQCFRKQNLNFVEILFTPYKIINPMYADFWNRLVENNELIARYDPIGAVKTMKGIAMEKFHAMEHEYPSKIELIQKYGYDPKQLSHLVRVREYMERFIAGEPYKDCLITRMPKHLKDLKNTSNVKLSLDEARALAISEKLKIEQLYEDFINKCSIDKNPEVDILLDRIQCNIMTKAIKLALAIM